MPEFSDIQTFVTVLFALFAGIIIADKIFDIWKKYKKPVTSIEERFKELGEKIDAVSDSVKLLVQDVATNNTSLREAIDMQEAINARIRILQASDEIRHEKKHSKEWFDQLNDDITHYEQYCSRHQEFKNNRAVQAIANINRVYANALKTNDFL